MTKLDPVFKAEFRTKKEHKEGGVVTPLLACIVSKSLGEGIVREEDQVSWA